MAEKTKRPAPLPEGTRLIRLPKLTKAQLRGIKELRDWEARSEMRLMGYRARN